MKKALLTKCFFLVHPQGLRLATLACIVRVTKNASLKLAFLGSHYLTLAGFSSLSGNKKTTIRWSFVGTPSGTLRSFRGLLALRTACTSLHSLPGAGKRSHRSVFFSALRVPSFLLSNKKTPVWVFFCWSG